MATYINTTAYTRLMRSAPGLSAPKLTGGVVPGASIDTDPAFYKIVDGYIWVKVLGKEQYVAMAKVTGQVVQTTLAVIDESYLEEKK